MFQTFIKSLCLKYHLLAWNAVDVVAENKLPRISCCDPNWSTATPYFRSGFERQIMQMKQIKIMYFNGDLTFA